MMMRRQRGAALLIAIALLGLLAVATLARTLASSADGNRVLTTERALARARDALAAYGALGNQSGNQSNSPGALPCPDLDNDGVSEQLSGACTAHIGRLPWRTLGMGPLLDGSGECLWYARSPVFSNNIPTSQRGSSSDKPALNPATPGGIAEISASGITGRKVAAVIIAPGPALSGQLRGGGFGLSGCRDGDIAQFVEGASVDGTAHDHASGKYAIAMREHEAFNDRILSLTTSRLFSTASARVLSEVATRGTDGTPPHAWWSNNQWCAHLCAAGNQGVIHLADGSQVTHWLPVIPACARTCGGP
jgi:type II secretory pathway pseudopilin PulG